MLVARIATRSVGAHGSEVDSTDKLSFYDIRGGHSGREHKRPRRYADRLTMTDTRRRERLPRRVRLWHVRLPWHERSRERLWRHERQSSRERSRVTRHVWSRVCASVRRWVIQPTGCEHRQQLLLNVGLPRLPWKEVVAEGFLPCTRHKWEQQRSVERANILFRGHGHYVFDIVRKIFTCVV